MEGTEQAQYANDAFIHLFKKDILAAKITKTESKPKHISFFKRIYQFLREFFKPTQVQKVNVKTSFFSEQIFKLYIGEE